MLLSAYEMQNLWTLQSKSVGIFLVSCRVENMTRVDLKTDPEYIMLSRQEVSETVAVKIELCVIGRHTLYPYNICQTLWNSQRISVPILNRIDSFFN